MGGGGTGCGSEQRATAGCLLRRRNGFGAHRGPRRRYLGGAFAATTGTGHRPRDPPSRRGGAGVTSTLAGLGGVPRGTSVYRAVAGVHARPAATKRRAQGRLGPRAV